MTDNTAGRPVTVDEFDGLPAGSKVRELVTNPCEVHGDESYYNDFEKQADGLWLLVGTDPEGEADFHLLQALGVVEPVDLDAFRDQWPAAATFRYELQTNEGEVAA